MAEKPTSTSGAFELIDLNAREALSGIGIIDEEKQNIFFQHTSGFLFGQSKKFDIDVEARNVLGRIGIVYPATQDRFFARVAEYLFEN